MPFVLLGEWGRAGQWGHMEYTGQPLNEAKKYKMLLDHYNLSYPNLTYLGASSANSGFLLDSLPTQIGQNTIYAFPNPSLSGAIDLISPEEGTARVFDISGALVKQLEVKEGFTKIDLTQEAKGLYFITVKGNTQVQNLKVQIK